MDEVLGSDSDLRSREEVDGGKVLNGAEAETLNSMLWEAADRIKRQRENSSRGYWRRRDRRDDHRRQRGPLAERFSDSPFDRPRMHKNSSSKPNRRSEKAKETTEPSEYSTDLSPNLGAFFEPFSTMMPLTMFSLRVHVATRRLVWRWREMMTKRWSRTRLREMPCEKKRRKEKKGTLYPGGENVGIRTEAVERLKGFDVDLSFLIYLI